MSSYHYKAISATGKRMTGVIEADNEKQAREHLRDKGWIPLRVHAASSKAKKTSLDHWRSWMQTQRLGHQHLALFTRQFATLLSAGLPVEEGLLAVSQQSESSVMQTIILSVRSRVMEGYGLGASMEAHPSLFSSLFSKTVSAGERTGHLDQVLLRLADYTEQQADIAQKLKTALIYPVMMVLVAFGIVSFLLTYVVPKMVTVYGHMHQALPFITRVLIGLSNGLQAAGVYLLLLVVLFVFGIRAALKRKKALRAKVQTSMLRLPLVGYIAKTADTARFARTLSILSTAGVPMLEAMRVSSQLIRLIPLHDAVLLAMKEVQEGGAIHSALKKTGYFSPMSIHMMASGEASGQLEPLLERVAKQQETDITRLIDTALALFEPAIILIMGAIVLFIVLAVLLPIFQLNDFTG